LLPIFYLIFERISKKTKIAKNNENSKKYVLNALCHLQHFFSMRLVVNTFFLTLMLLFLKKNKIQEKLQFTKGLNVKNRKKVKGSIGFWITWSPSLLGEQTIKNNKLFYL